MSGSTKALELFVIVVAFTITVGIGALIVAEKEKEDKPHNDDVFDDTQMKRLKYLATQASETCMKGAVSQLHVSRMLNKTTHIERCLCNVTNLIGFLEQARRMPMRNEYKRPPSWKFEDPRSTEVAGALVVALMTELPENWYITDICVGWDGPGVNCPRSYAEREAYTTTYSIYYVHKPPRVTGLQSMTLEELANTL